MFDNCIRQGDADMMGDVNMMKQPHRRCLSYPNVNSEFDAGWTSKSKIGWNKNCKY